MITILTLCKSPRPFMEESPAVGLNSRLIIVQAVVISGDRKKTKLIETRKNTAVM